MPRSPALLPTFRPRRPLGRTGFTATAVGIGDLADRSSPRATLVDTLRRALDAGLNVIDTAPQYEGGLSEELVGEALRGRRDSVFLIDKVDHLDQPVTPQIDASLKRLGHEHADLFVFHNLSDLAVWKKLTAPGGGFDELARCVTAGKARFKGLSSHHPDVLREALASGLCDVVMFPLGPFVDARYVDEILPEARRRGVGVVSFKTFGGGKLLGDTEGYGKPLANRDAPELKAPTLPRLSVEECVRFTLTLDPDVMLMGLSTPEEQDPAIAAAAAFQPMRADELADVRARAAKAVEGKGKIWWNPSH